MVAAAMAIATAMATDSDDNNDGSGRRVMGRQVWGRQQAAEGGRNGNKVEMVTMWV